MKKLLAFDGNLAIKACCAKPQHKLREATWADVREWIETHEQHTPESACMCQSEEGSV